MRAYLLTLMVCVGVWGMAGCGESEGKSEKSEKAGKAEKHDGKHEDVAGGISPTDAADADVKAAAEFAVAALAKQTGEKLVLKKIVEAKSQIVAGTNYFLVLEVTGGKATIAEVVVWSKLDGSHEMTKSAWRANK